MDDKHKKDLLDKVSQVNKKDETISFKIEFEGKVLHETKISMGNYAKEIFDSNPDFYYFFKDTASQLDKLIAEKHKEKIWKEMGK